MQGQGAGAGQQRKKTECKLLPLLARTVQQGADDYSEWQCEDRGGEVKEKGVYGDPSITELPVKTAQLGENVFSKD